MSRIEDLGDRYAGLWRWESDPDRDGDQVTAVNCRRTQGLVLGTGQGKNWNQAYLTSVEARALALAILDLLDGQCPTTTQHMEDH